MQFEIGFLLFFFPDFPTSADNICNSDFRDLLQILRFSYICKFTDFFRFHSLDLKVDPFGGHET